MLRSTAVRTRPSCTSAMARLAPAPPALQMRAQESRTEKALSSSSLLCIVETIEKEGGVTAVYFAGFRSGVARQFAERSHLGMPAQHATQQLTWQFCR